MIICAGAYVVCSRPFKMHWRSWSSAGTATAAATAMKVAMIVMNFMVKVIEILACEGVGRRSIGLVREVVG
jgi:hypothetical protein